MPLLFLGHGSPMNAIEENIFVTGFKNIATTLPKPAAVLCISAHWETKGTLVTAIERPSTIHDFGGFPEALFNVQYPAPGDPALAREIKKIVQKTMITLDHKRGLDHGCWSVMKHLFPQADIPIVQMSIDYSMEARYHYELAKELAPLRKQNILIVGSGNIVHNLNMVSWDDMNGIYGYDWALEVRNKINACILNNDHETLIKYDTQGSSFDLAIPTPEHFLPLLYILGLKEKDEDVFLFNDLPVAGSLSMTSLKVG